MQVYASKSRPPLNADARGAPLSLASDPIVHGWGQCLTVTASTGSDSRFNGAAGFFRDDPARHEGVPDTGACHGIVFALPIAAALWIAVLVLGLALWG